MSIERALTIVILVLLIIFLVAAMSGHLVTFG